MGQSNCFPNAQYKHCKPFVVSCKIRQGFVFLLSVFRLFDCLFYDFFSLSVSFSLIFILSMFQIAFSRIFHHFVLCLFVFFFSPSIDFDYLHEHNIDFFVTLLNFESRNPKQTNKYETGVKTSRNN